MAEITAHPEDLPPNGNSPTDPDIQKQPITHAHDEAPDESVLDKPEQPIAPDQFGEGYQTTKREIWAYYSCVQRRLPLPPEAPRSAH